MKNIRYKKLVVILFSAIFFSLIFFLSIGYSLHIPVRLPSIHPQIIVNGNESFSVNSIGSGAHDYAPININVDMRNHDTFELLENKETLIKIEKKRKTGQQIFFDVKIVIGDNYQPVTSTVPPDNCTFVRSFSGEWTSGKCFLDFDKLTDDTDIAISFALGGWDNNKEGFGISIASFPSKDLTSNQNPFVWLRKRPLMLSIKLDSMAPIDIVNAIKQYHFPFYLEKDGYLLP